MTQAGAGPSPEAGADAGTFSGASGAPIHWRSWAPATDPARAVIVIVHGLGEHCGRYEWVAGRLAEHGYAVFALDHHGHGRSGGRRGRFSMQTAVADVDQLVQRAVAEHDGAPVVILGHSLGGLITLRYALAHGERLQGLILSGTLAQVDGRRAAKAVGRVLGRVVPALPVARVDPAALSHDPAVVAAYTFDPLVSGTVTAAIAAELLAQTDGLEADLPRLTLPTLVIWGTADRICAPAGSEMVAARLGGADTTARPFPGLYHELLNEPEREQVLDEIVAWLARRYPPLR